MTTYNLDLDKDLHKIANICWEAEKMLKQTCEKYHKLSKFSPDHLDLSYLDDQQCDIEAFRLNHLVPLIKLQKEAKEAEEEADYDNDNPGDLSYDQMGLKVGRG